MHQAIEFFKDTLNSVLLSKLILTSLLVLLLMAMAWPVYAAHDTDRKVKYWVAPMDPNFQRDKPGKSPMGMDLLPIYEQAGHHAQVKIAAGMVQNLGIRTTKAERRDLSRLINTVGYVGYDEEKISHAHLRVSGWLEYLAAHSVGQRFKKGDVLLKVYSLELINAQQDFLHSVQSGDERLINSSRRRLRTLGFKDAQTNRLKKSKKVLQTVPVRAKHNGVVSKLTVRNGMYVTPADEIMSLADLSSVWVLVDVFEKQANWLQQGDAAEVRFSYLPNRIWKGKIDYIYPSLNKKTRTLQVRLHFDNSDGLLKPNMYGKVKILSKPKQNVLVVPIQSIIRTGTTNRLIVRKAKTTFEPRDVRLGIESDGFVEILSGLEEGEEVVVSGQFLIDSEANLQGSFTRMKPVELDND